ncbi:MAG: DNA polymerase III subunit chi [Gammaproteobacteria bacterium]
MTQVDFYVLKETAPRARLLFVCRLLEKVFHLGQRGFVQLASETEVHALDELLWTFRDGSFLPHAPATSNQGEPLLLGCSEEPVADCQLLVNLVPVVPEFFSRFERVAEVVDADPETRARGRERFRFYKDRGYPVEVHNL